MVERTLNLASIVACVASEDVVKTLEETRVEKRALAPPPRGERIGQLDLEWTTMLPCARRIIPPSRLLRHPPAGLRSSVRHLIRGSQWMKGIGQESDILE